MVRALVSESSGPSLSQPWPGHCVVGHFILSASFHPGVQIGTR